MTDRSRSGNWFGGPPPPAGADAPAEESMRVARRLSAPDTAGISRAGLPIRTPQAHLVPGSFGGGEKSSTRDTPPPPERSAEEVRKHLDGYRTGVRRARSGGTVPSGQ